MFKIFKKKQYAPVRPEIDNEVIIDTSEEDKKLKGNLVPDYIDRGVKYGDTHSK